MTWLMKSLQLLLQLILELPNLWHEAEMRVKALIWGRPLANKVVLLTGASSGIGRAAAKYFYLSGCKVILASRKVDELEKVKSELLELKEPSLHTPAVLRLDLSDLDSIPAKATEASDIFGKIDILINNAGVSTRGSAEDTELSVYQRLMDVNYFSVVALTSALLPSMLKSQSGHLVNVSSLQGLIAMPHRSSYSASKHALQAYSDSLRHEIESRGVDVTVVSPGYVQTQISVNSYDAKGQRYGKMDDEIATGYTADYMGKMLYLAVASRTREISVSILPHLLVVTLRRLWPSLAFAIIGWTAAKKQKMK